MKPSQIARGAKLLRIFTILANMLWLLSGSARAQFDLEEKPPFEVYAEASLMGTATVAPPALVIGPKPIDDVSNISGGASGFRTGLAWTPTPNLGLVGDFGYHSYSDHRGSITLATLMAGPRFSTVETFRTTWYLQTLFGGYRWNVQSPEQKFTHGKFAASVAGGVDFRLTEHFVFRAFEGEIMLLGVEKGPQLDGRISSGFVYRFGGKK